MIANFKCYLQVFSKWKMLILRNIILKKPSNIPMNMSIPLRCHNTIFLTHQFVCLYMVSQENLIPYNQDDN